VTGRTTAAARVGVDVVVVAVRVVVGLVVVVIGVVVGAVVVGVVVGAGGDGAPHCVRKAPTKISATGVANRRKTLISQR